VIAKRIKRTKTRDTFKRLAGYVLNEKNGGKADPVTWELAEYVFDSAHEGEKVAYWRVTNCGAEDPGFAVKEIIATQERNTRSKSDKSYHLVISFPPGEQPTREQIEEIEDHLVASIGLQEHQRISAVHQNTDCWHLHVAINKVHPTTLRNVEPYYDQPRLQAACAEMEIKHDLTRTNHGLKPEQPLNGKPAEMEAHAGRMSFHRWLIENAKDALVRGAVESTNWQQFHAVVARFGAVIKQRGAGLIIAHRDNDRIRVKASAIDRSLSFKALTDRWGQYEPPALARQATAPEPSQAAQSQAPQAPPPPAPQSAQTPTRQSQPTQPTENIQNRVDLSAGHPRDIPGTSRGRPPDDIPMDAMQAPDLTEDPPDEIPMDAMHVPPPENDDGPTGDAPTGAAPTGEEGQPQPMVYDAAPMQGSPQTQNLWLIYQRERRAAEEARERAMTQLRAGHSAYRKEVADWYRKRFKAARVAHIGKAERADSFQLLRRSQRKDRHALLLVEGQERKAVREGFPIPTWQGFLEREAENGNTDALAVLRSRQRRRDRIERAILAADTAGEATHIVHKRLRPIARHDGTMIYIVADGGIVSDGRADIAVTKLSTGAAYLALELASQRFTGRALAVHGDDEFRGLVARLAGIEGVGVTFSDQTLETMRENQRHSLETGVAEAHTVSDIPEMRSLPRHGERDTGRT
jgi:hypothetical protein